MRNERLWRVSLTLAGIMECGMALAHFGLQYEWSTFDFGDLPAQLAWALLALNFSWSILVLGIGGLGIYAAIIGPASSTLMRGSCLVSTDF